MRDFFDRLNAQLAGFMQGRYGSDTLNKVLIGVVFVLLIFQMLTGFLMLSFVTWVLIFIVLFRSLSRNLKKRQAENEKFLTLIKGPKKFFTCLSTKWRNRKTTVYFKCKGCGVQLSVPKGKGKLRIVCPKCKTEIFKNT